MSYHVYILYLPGHMRTYVGQTNDIATRLDLHNTGRVRSTKAFVPWTLIHAEHFSTRADAMRREEWLKSVAGRKFITALLAEWRSGLSDPAIAGSRSRSDIVGTD